MPKGVGRADMMKIDVSEFDVVLWVKPDLTWTGLIASTVRSYSKSRNYPSRLVDDLIAAVGEAIEQLISLCVGSNISTPFEVGFLWQDEAVQVHLVYDASIPLNPYKEPDYEVPSLGGHSDPSLEGLWLHLIKHTMDRVFFRLDGESLFGDGEILPGGTPGASIMVYGLMPACVPTCSSKAFRKKPVSRKQAEQSSTTARRAVFRLSTVGPFYRQPPQGKEYPP